LIPACAKTCPTDSIQFGPVRELIPRLICMELIKIIWVVLAIFTCSSINRKCTLCRKSRNYNFL
jgi:ferredoxin